MSEKNRKLRELSTDELQRKLEDAQEELMNLRFQQATGELSDFTRLRYTHRQIARLITIIYERERQPVMEGEA
jgi:large subunit ribosomal protein L29